VDTKRGLDTVVGIEAQLWSWQAHKLDNWPYWGREKKVPLQILPPNYSVLPYLQSSNHSLKRNSVIMSTSSRGRLTHVRVQCSLWKNGRSLERQPHHPQDLGRGHGIFTSRELMWRYACSWDVRGNLTLNSTAQIHTSLTLLASRDLTWSSGRLTRQHASHIFVVAHISWDVTYV